MASIKDMAPNKPNRFDFVVIPRMVKKDGTDASGWDEEHAMTIARMYCSGQDWDGGLKLSGFWTALRRGMENEIIEVDDADAILAGVEGAKKYVQGRKSQWFAENTGHKTAQAECYVDVTNRKLRVKEDAREGYFRVDSKGRALPFTEGSYVLLMQAIEDQIGNPDLKTDKPGGLLTLRPFKASHTKLHEYVGKFVKWELRETPNL
jgi:hypothetical protein